MVKKPTVRFVVKNRVTAVYPSRPSLVERLKTYFRFQPLSDEELGFSPKFQDGFWDGYIYMYKRGYVPTGLFFLKRDELEEKFNVVVEDQRKMLSFRKLPSYLQKAAREFQRESLEAMKLSTGGMVLNCTGSGKTMIAGLFAKALVGRLCFVVHELTLLKQTRKALQKMLQEPVGMVGAGIQDIDPRVTVATIQSLSRFQRRPEFKKWFRHLDAVVLDELHLILNDRTIEVVNAIRAKAVFGLTATLQLEKPEILLPAVALTGPVVYTYPLRRGQEEGYISKGIALRVRVAQKNPMRYGMSQYKQLVVTSNRRNDCIAALVREGYMRGHTTAVLVEHRAHLANLSARLEDVPHMVLSGANSVQERERVQQRMEEGKIKVLLTNRIFATGIDITRLDVTIDGTATYDTNNVQQRFGRGVRKHEDKAGLIHLDIADATPKGAVLDNPLAKASLARAEALRGLGIPVSSISWANSATAVWDAAENQLREALRTV